jgi:hypothetical protein
MKYMDLVKHTQISLENAENNISKLNSELLNLEGLSGKKTRHFYNNILNKDNMHYFEIGTWKGSSVCSAMFENNATVVCCDNWSEFNGPKSEFLHNFNKFKGNNNARFIEENCWNINSQELPKFNVYLYDGDHSREAHYKALTHFIDAMDSTFIFIVDDWNWEQIRTPTLKSIQDLKLKVLFEKEIRLSSNDQVTHERETWWNGMYVAVLQK